MNRGETMAQRVVNVNIMNEVSRKLQNNASIMNEKIASANSILKGLNIGNLGTSVINKSVNIVGTYNNLGNSLGQEAKKAENIMVNLNKGTIGADRENISNAKVDIPSHGGNTNTDSNNKTNVVYSSTGGNDGRHYNSRVDAENVLIQQGFNGEKAKNAVSEAINNGKIFTKDTVSPFHAMAKDKEQQALNNLRTADDQIQIASAEHAEIGHDMDKLRWQNENVITNYNESLDNLGSAREKYDSAKTLYEQNNNLGNRNNYAEASREYSNAYETFKINEAKLKDFTGKMNSYLDEGQQRYDALKDAQNQYSFAKHNYENAVATSDKIRDISLKFQNYNINNKSTNINNSTKSPIIDRNISRIV